ncbi:MAG: hypothetical protein GY947_23080 [Rhodobacteraceae bacterium]|nr:hypothetical protein [Paracoccaceae bacterium]
MASTIEGEKAPKTAISSASGHAWSTDLKFGRYKAAINQLDSALRAGKLDEEQRAVALINRGLAHQQLKQYKQAVADYSAALKADALATKTRAVVVYNRGIAHQKLRRQALAIEDFTNALYLDVEFAHAYYGRGRLMQEVGRHEFALADFRMAMKYHHPSPHLPFYGQALAYHSTQQTAKARKALSRALLIKPNFKPALDKYAELTGKPYNSRRMVQPASKISPIIAKRSSKSITSNRASTGEIAKLSGNNLPKAVAPTAEMLAAAGTSEKFVAVDPIVTGSISKSAQTGKQPVETKLPFRYPGMVGATKPVPAMTPRAALTDLRPQAESQQKTSELTSQTELVNEVRVTSQTTETATDNSVRTRVAYLGGSTDVGLGSTTEREPSESAKVSVSAQQPVPDAAQPDEQLRGWFIQLNAQRSEDAAKEVWQKYKSKYGRALRGTNVVYQRADLGDKGIYWRVRLGSYKGRNAAAKKCRRLKRSGLRCFVVKAG